MPLSDFIRVRTRYASPPLGIPSLQIPIVGWSPTTDQRTAWVAEYGSSNTPNVVEITPSSWQDVLDTIGVTSGEALDTALTDLFAQKVDGQPAQPAKVLLALRQVPVAMVRTAVVGGSSGTYTLTLDGTDYVVPYNASVNQTATDVRSAVNADLVIPVTASGAGANVVLTADEPGVPFTSATAHSVSSVNFTITTTTANVGTPEDIELWDSENPRGYFLLLVSRVRGVQIATARAWETRTSERPGQYWFQTDDEDAQDGASTDDIASVLIDEGITRSRAFWHDDPENYVEFAACGKTCAFQPGLPNQVHQSLISVTGINAPTLSSPANLETKRYSFLERFLATEPPTSSTRGGRMLDGNWVDLVHGADAVNRTVEIRVYQALLDSNTPYIGGEPTVEGAIRGAVAEFEGPPGKAFLVAGQTIVTVPPASSQDEGDRLDREYEDVTWSAPIQGKLNGLGVQGFLAQ